MAKQKEKINDTQELKLGTASLKNTTVNKRADHPVKYGKTI